MLHATSKWAWFCFCVLAMLPLPTIQGQDAAPAPQLGDAAGGSAAGEAAESEAVESATELADRDIRRYFNAYEQATADDSADRLIGLFDFERFVDAVIEEAAVPVPDGMRALLVKQTAAMTKRQFEALDETWTRHRVIQIIYAEDHLVAEAYVRNWSEDLTTTRTVFSLHRTPDGWKAFDWQDVSLGFSTVSLTAAILRDGTDSQFPPEIARAVRLLFKAMMAALQEDTDSAEAFFDQATGLPLPPMMESLRWNLMAALHVEYDPVLALECLDKVEAFDQRVVIADFMRVSAHMSLGNFDDVIRYAERYLGRFGADADTYMALGMALNEVGRQEEAVEALKAGMEDTPESLDVLDALATVLPKDQKQEFRPYFLALPNPMEQFELLADSLEASEDGEALQVLLEAAGTISKEIPHQPYYEAVVLFRTGQAADAFESVREALADLKDDEDYQEFYESLLCEIGAEISKELEAYRACEDESQAFENLVFYVDYGGEQFELNVDESAPVEEIEKKINEDRRRRNQRFGALAAIHLERSPEDAGAWEQVAGRWYEHSEYKEAIECFSKALEYCDDEDQKASIAEQRLDCYVQIGKPLDGYRIAEDKRSAFNSLRWQLEEGSETLKSLNDLHRKAFPHEFQFVEPDIVRLLEADKPVEALSLLEASLLGSQETEGWETSRLNYLKGVAHALLERFDEALIGARKLDPFWRDRLRAIVYACKGDQKRFGEALELAQKENGEVERDEIQKFVSVPDDWFPENSGRPEEEETSPYYRYQEPRRFVFLLSEPILISGYRVKAAADKMGMRLFEIERAQLSSASRDFIATLNDSSVLLGTEGCQYFLSTSDERYPGVGQVEWEIEDDEALSHAVANHRGWFAIDLFVWPQDLSNETPEGIPRSASRRMADLSRLLVDSMATVALHVDSETYCKVDESFFDRLCGEDVLSAFEGVTGSDEEESSGEEGDAGTDQPKQLGQASDPVR